MIVISKKYCRIYFFVYICELFLIYYMDEISLNCFYLYITITILCLKNLFLKNKPIQTEQLFVQIKFIPKWDFVVCTRRVFVQLINSRRG